MDGVVELSEEDLTLLVKYFVSRVSLKDGDLNKEVTDLAQVLVTRLALQRLRPPLVEQRLSVEELGHERALDEIWRLECLDAVHSLGLITSISLRVSGQ